jgi:hypothetical protein
LHWMCVGGWCAHTQKEPNDDGSVYGARISLADDDILSDLFRVSIPGEKSIKY